MLSICKSGASGSRLYSHPPSRKCGLEDPQLLHWVCVVAGRGEGIGMMPNESGWSAMSAWTLSIFPVGALWKDWTQRTRSVRACSADGSGFWRQSPRVSSSGR